MKHRSSLWPLRAPLLALALTSTVLGCAADFDTSRATPKRSSLGLEMYTLLCDRVGAQGLREDLTGASFHGVCHGDGRGTFAAEVDRSKLPPLDPTAKDDKGRVVPIERQREERDHQIARIEALARRRTDLADAFDAGFTGEEIPVLDLDNRDPARACEPAKGRAVDLREEIGATLGRLGDLYRDDTIPHVTRGLAKITANVEASPEAQAAFARIGARHGYRQEELSAGAIGPALSYARLAELANALLRLYSSNADPFADDRKAGPGNDALRALLAALREELRTAGAAPAPAPLVVTRDPADPFVERLSRPRGALEAMRQVLFTRDAVTSGAPQLVVLRDTRGVARVASEDGRVPAPFVDLTGVDGKPDGLPDLDALGAFITTGGAAPTPFALGKEANASRDELGRAVSGSRPVFEYVDAGSTYLATILRRSTPLLDPDDSVGAMPLVDLLGGLVIATGTREDKPTSTREYAPDPRSPNKGKVVLKYRGFRESESPLLDLVNAFGQTISAPEIDNLLALVQKLAEEHPELLARITGALLRGGDIAQKHPEATIPDTSTAGDDLFDVIAKISREPGLLEDVIRTLADDASLGIPRALASQLSHRDELTYDKNNLNGPGFNVTTGRVEGLVTDVDRQKPDSGANRSAFQRFLQGVHDVKGTALCTKQGAVAHIVFKGLPLDYPSLAANAACLLIGAPSPPRELPACGLFRVDDVSSTLIEGVAGTMKLVVQDECLRKLIESPLTQIVGGGDALLEEVSGINGFRTTPTTGAILRFAYFDLPHDGAPGDTGNAKTNKFLDGLFEPPATRLCAPSPFTAPDGKSIALRKCTSFADSLPGHDKYSLFPVEQDGFLDAIKPLAKTFVVHGKQTLLVDAVDALHLHWGSSKQSADECTKTGNPDSNGRFCFQDGLVSYEPLVADLMKSDLVPALHDAVKTLMAMKVGNADGVSVVAEAVRAMVDPERNKGVTTRSGQATGHRNDGAQTPQVTRFDLLTGGLSGINRSFEVHAATHLGDDRRPGWRNARSKLADAYLAVDGSGPNAHFQQPSLPKMLNVAIGMLRSQVRAHCPDLSKSCEWARTELTKNMAETITGPAFAGAVDTFDAIHAQKDARVELGRFLQFMIQSTDGLASRATLTAVFDMLQLVDDDATFVPLLRASADAAAAEVRDKDGRVIDRGLILAGVELMSRVFAQARDEKGRRECGREIDPNRAMPVVMRRLLTPIPERSKSEVTTPLDILMDVAADVNRRHPEETTKLASDDYASIAHEVSDFLTNQSSGLEQLYTVIKNASQSEP